MIDYSNKELFYTDSTDKQLLLHFDSENAPITNTDIFSESMTISESLCSEEQLRFGSCEPSSFKIKIANSFVSHTNDILRVNLILNHETDKPFLLGTYKVVSDEPTADRSFREIMAYDNLYFVLTMDVAEWYNSIFPNDKTTMTLAQFRNSFFANIGLRHESVVLPNDNMIIRKTVEPSELSAKTVLHAILEINGCFGHIARDGSFRYVFLKELTEALYPANNLYPQDELYPREQGNMETLNPAYYKPGTTYKDFHTNKIARLQIRNVESDIGVIVGKNKGNTYIVEDNFLLYGMTESELTEVANNMYVKIKNVTYRPATSNACGNPCIEVGDGIRFNTKYDIIGTYVLERTLSGIQSLNDYYESKGVEYYGSKVNGYSAQIIQLKGKTNTIERSVEETRSTIEDLDKNLSSQIVQNAQQISAEVKRATEAEGTLTTKVTQTANSLTAEVTRAQGVEGTLSSRISVNEKGISTKVSKGSVSSEISQEANEISIRSNRLYIQSDNFTLNRDGSISAKNANISGTVTANSGRFDNVTITGSCSVAGQSISGQLGSGVSYAGQSIGEGYIGNLSAGKITAGTLSRPLSIGGNAFNSGGIALSTGGMTSNVSVNYMQNINAQNISGRIAAQAGSSQIGSKSNPFHLTGTFTNTSSRKFKRDIVDYSIDDCLDVIKSTKVVSYHYLSDVDDFEKKSEEIKGEYDCKLSAISKELSETNSLNREGELKKEAKKVCKEINQRIDDLSESVSSMPFMRYGFIAEDSPIELTGRTKDTVDLYNCIAMCFGAIQKQALEIEELKQKVADLERGNDE